MPIDFLKNNLQNGGLFPSFVCLGTLDLMFKSHIKANSVEMCFTDKKGFTKGGNYYSISIYARWQRLLAQHNDIHSFMSLTAPRNVKFPAYSWPSRVAFCTTSMCRSWAFLHTGFWFMGRGGPERVAYMKRENEPVLLESCNFFSWREPTTCIILAYVVDILNSY